jgi:hypothetical protein
LATRAKKISNFFLAQRKVIVALGQRADGHMSALISPLKSIINAFLNGQLVLPSRRTKLFVA